MSHAKKPRRGDKSIWDAFPWSASKSGKTKPPKQTDAEREAEERAKRAGKWLGLDVLG